MEVNGIIIEEKGNELVLSNLWKDNTFICLIDKSVGFNFLNNIELHEELIAIYHKPDNKIEYIFTVIKEDDPIIKRAFDFNYLGVTFKCYFNSPTDILKLLSSGFREIDSKSDSDYRNLNVLRDYYLQDKLPNYIKKFFKGRKPYSFFVEGKFDKINWDYINLSKHLNFYMGFFDRKTPSIVILNKQEKLEEYNQPCLSQLSGFPGSINSTQINSIILDIILAANRTDSIRLKYIFYYQVLEYCSFYYLNEKLKKRLQKILKSPDISFNLTDYSKSIIDEFKDHFKQNNDSQKLELLISEFCDVNDISLEVKSNINYFCKEITFEGGFSVPPVLNCNDNLNNPPKNFIREIKTNIENIRNVLVHLRESRENKVILPTEKNDNLLMPYLHLIRRIAEQVSIDFE